MKEIKRVVMNILGKTWKDNNITNVKKLIKTFMIYGYKYSTSDELAIHLNTLQTTGETFGIKSVKFVALDKNKEILDTIEVPKNIIITKGTSKKLSIQLLLSLKGVNKFIICLLITAICFLRSIFPLYIEYESYLKYIRIYTQTIIAIIQI